MQPSIIFEQLCWDLCKFEYQVKLVLSKGIIAGPNPYLIQHRLFPSFYIDFRPILSNYPNGLNNWCSEADIVVLSKNDIHSIRTTDIESDSFLEINHVDDFFKAYVEKEHRKKWWQPYQSGLSGIKRDWQLIENDENNCIRKRNGSSINFKYGKSPEVAIDSKYYHNNIPRTQIETLLIYGNLMRAKECILMIPGPNVCPVPKGFEIIKEFKKTNSYTDFPNISTLWEKLNEHEPRCQSVFMIKNSGYQQPKAIAPDEFYEIYGSKELI